MTLPLPASPLTLRPYQVQAQQAVRTAWAKGTTGPLIVLATGTGKTVTAMGLVAEALERGERVVWVAHRDELITQPRDTLLRFWPEHGDKLGIVKSSSNEADAQLVFASVQTLAATGRLQQVVDHGLVDLLVVDECHRSGAPEYQKVIEGVSPGRRLGLSATPEREDGVNLSDSWEIVASLDIDQAIRGGFLKPPYAARVRIGLDLDPDADPGEIDPEFLEAEIVRQTVEAIMRPHKAVRLPWRDDQAILSARGRSCLVFTATVPQAVATAEALNKAGRVARWVSGAMPMTDRHRVTAALKSGAVEIGCNAAVYIEGTDIPRISCVVIARPCRSRVLFVQAVGRGLRLFEGHEDCLVIDLAGATEIHSLVAAPVLVGETQCPKSPNRVHRFHEDEGKAVCDYCDKSLPCWEALQVGRNDGRHVYVDGECRHCGAVQCPEAPERRHVWIPEIDAGAARKRCIWCDRLTRDPLGGLARERRLTAPVKAAWTEIPGLSPRTWAVDLGEAGIVFVLERGDLREPVYLPKRARKPRRMGLVTRDKAILYVNDLLRRAEPRWDSLGRAEVVGGHGRREQRDWVARAMARALNCGVLEWGA